MLLQRLHTPAQTLRHTRPSPALTVMSSTASTSSDAGSPFNDTQADVIIRSADKVDFYMYSLDLRRASSVFKKMLDLPKMSNVVVDADADAGRASSSGSCTNTRRHDGTGRPTWTWS